MSNYPNHRGGTSQQTGGYTPANLSVHEYERATARGKSYTGSAVLVLVLYFVLYIPGLIANYMFLQEAKRTRQVAGQDLPGMGCLSAMWYGNLIWLALVCGFIAIVALASRLIARHSSFL